MFFRRLWPKTMDKLLGNFGQNFIFPKTFCIAKTSREMMFGEVFRVIGNKVQANCFIPLLAKNHEQTPWEFGQN